MSHPLIAETALFFFSELNKRGIRYAVLRKIERIPDAIGNDIDVVIDEREKPAVLEVICGCVEKFGHGVYERKDVSGLYAILYSFVEGKLIFLRLDFTNPVENPETLLERRIRNERGIYYLPPGVYVKKPKHNLQGLFTYPWRLLFPPGRLAVIVGPDGVGKSTTAELIVQLFEAFHIPVTHMHLGFRPRILPTKKSIVTLGKQKEATPGEVSTTPGLVRFLYHTLDHFLGYFVKIRPLLVKGRYVIGERYYYSYLVDPRPKKRYGVPVWLIRLAFVCMPKPDIAILLSNDPRKIYERRQEHSVEEIARQIEAYRKEGMCVGKFIEVETDKPPARVAVEIVQQLTHGS